MTFGATILAILGLASGWFLDANHRRGVIIAAIFLGMAGGAGALGGIVSIGAVLTKILSSLGAVFAAASVMAIVRTLVELSTIESLGKLTQVPYWRCLQIDHTNPAIVAESREWFVRSGRLGITS